MNVTDMDYYKLNKDLEEIAWLLGVEDTLFKMIVADMYIKGFQDCIDKKGKNFDVMKKLRSEVS